MIIQQSFNAFDPRHFITFVYLQPNKKWSACQQFEEFKKVLSHLFSTAVAVICLRQHLCMALWAVNMGLLNLCPAHHAEIGLRWKVLVACVTSVDYHHLMSAVRAKSSIYTHG
jgi:hypothetical protein